MVFCLAFAVEVDSCSDHIGQRCLHLPRVPGTCRICGNESARRLLVCHNVLEGAILRIGGRVEGAVYDASMLGLSEKVVYEASGVRSANSEVP